MKEYIIKNLNYKMRYHDMPGEDTPILFIHGLGCAGSFDYLEVATQQSLLAHRRIDKSSINIYRSNLDDIVK